jgi:hypothetical protein
MDIISLPGGLVGYSVTPHSLTIMDIGAVIGKRATTDDQEGDIIAVEVDTVGLYAVMSMAGGEVIRVRMTGNGFAFVK